MTDQYNANPSKSLRRSQFEEYFPRPTHLEREDGRMERYFMQRHGLNESIIEIDRSTYQRFKTNNMYKTIALTWRIGGPEIDEYDKSVPPVRIVTGIETANRLTIEMASKTLPGLQYKLRNLRQFSPF